MKPDELKAAIKASLPSGEDIQLFVPDAVANGKYYSVAVTPNRLVMCRKKLAGFSNEDYPASRFDKVTLEEGWLKAKLTIKFKDGSEMELERLKKEDGRKFAGLVRTMIAMVEIGPNSTKICPDCGAQLKYMAKTCPYCNFQFANKANM